MEVQTVYNPAAVDIPELRAALEPWAKQANYFDHLKTFMATGGAAIIIGTMNDTRVDGASIVVLPQAFTDEMPWVVHFHNDGSRALTHMMVKSTLDFIRQAGYTTYKAFNQSGRPDKVWLRIFKQGGKPQFVGSAYIFDLEGISNGSNSSDRRRARPGAGGRTIRRKRAKVAKQHNAARSDDTLVSAARPNAERKPRKSNRGRAK